MQNNLELKHYGVLGMKWGIRRDRKVGSTSSRSKPKKERIKDISDEELRKRVNRLNLERQYRDLVSNDPNTNRGRKALKRLLATATTVATATTTAITLYNNSNKIKEIIQRNMNG